MPANISHQPIGQLVVPRIELGQVCPLEVLLVPFILKLWAEFRIRVDLTAFISWKEMMARLENKSLLNRFSFSRKA